MIAVFGLALLLWLALRYMPKGNDSLDNRPPLKRLLWVFITLGIIGIVMLAVWSPVLNAFFTEGKGYTERVSQLDPHLANFGQPFPLAALVSLFFPFATLIFPSWFNADYSMTNGYVGLLTIPFAALWLIKGGSSTGDGRRRIWWLFVFALFMFILSLGGQAGLRTILYYIYPPIRFMRFSAPFRVFWMFPLSLAAGLGFSYLQKHPEDRALMFKIFMGWVAVGLCVGIAVAVAIACASDEISTWEVFPNLYLPAIIIAVFAGVLFWYWSRERQGFLYKLAPVLILAVAAADMSMHLYNNSFTVFTKNNVISRVESMHVRSTHVDGEPGPRQPRKLLGFMNVQQVLKIPDASGYVTMKSKGFDEVLLNSRFIEVMSAPYRFWLSPGVTPVEYRDSALSILANTGGNEPVPVFIEDATVPLPDAKAVPGSFGETRIVSYDPEKIEMKVKVPSGAGGFLASTERYSTGWKAYVDGKEQKVYKTNLYFRGIFLAPGSHFVIWRYEPRLWKQLVVFSYSSLALTVGAAAYMILRRRKLKR